MKQLTPRQSQIYQYILRHGSASNSEVKTFLDSQHGLLLSRLTIIRDIDTLIAQNYLVKYGAGRNTRYKPLQTSPLLRHFDPIGYFQVDMDQRQIYPAFTSAVINRMDHFFTDAELRAMSALTLRYQKNKQALSLEQQKREWQRLTIELSWKSSQIEGNTYSLLDTEALLYHNHLAANTTKEEAQMIRNHKRALDYCLLHPEEYSIITLRKVEDIHRLLVEDLDVSHGLRKGLVRITGTNYKPLDNSHQIQENLEKMITCINNQGDAFHKALTAILLISYIQPFMDGNKRTGRLVGNALLNQAGACPLSYRSVDPVDYKKAMLLFYEQHSLKYFKELFMAQYQFSVETYFI